MLTRSSPACWLSCWVPCQSMSNSTSRPLASASHHRLLGRAVAVAEHGGVLEELAAPRPCCVEHARARRRNNPCPRPRSARLARVVAETRHDDVAGSLCSSRRDRVVLPAPDGEDSTSIRPRRLISSFAHSTFWACSRNWSITALSARPVRVSAMSDGFGAQRVGFAVEFLGQEIELAARRPRPTPAARARPATWACKPVQFLAHIGLHRQQRHFLRQPVFGDARRRPAIP